VPTLDPDHMPCAERETILRNRIMELENELTMQGAILESVMGALAGDEPSDFLESFVEVAAAQAARSCLEDIVSIEEHRNRGDAETADRAKGTLMLLGNYPKP